MSAAHRARSALLAAQDYLRRCASPEPTYGYFPGGDPRDFSPDEESCTEAEIAAWKDACAAWERGERPVCEAHRHEIVGDEAGKIIASISFAGAFGLGVYSIRDVEAEDVLEQIGAALAELEAA